MSIAFVCLFIRTETNLPVLQLTENGEMPEEQDLPSPNSIPSSSSSVPASPVSPLLSDNHTSNTTSEQKSDFPPSDHDIEQSSERSV